MSLDQSALIEILFHRELGTQKTDLFQSCSFDGLSGRIGNMEDGNSEMFLNFVGDLVHCIGAEENEICPACLRASRSSDQNLSSFVPLSLMLQGFDCSKIDGNHHAFGRMETAKLTPDGLVNKDRKSTRLNSRHGS